MPNKKQLILSLTFSLMSAITPLAAASPSSVSVQKQSATCTFVTNHSKRNHNSKLTAPTPGKFEHLSTRHKYGSRPAEGVPIREFLFTQNLPLNKLQVHASTLAALEDGTLVCAAFYGSGESHKDVSIIVSRKKTGSSWETPRIVSSPDGHPHWNPVLYTMTPGTLTLFYKEGISPGKWTTLVQDSTDAGLTWSTPRKLVETDTKFGRGPSKNKLLTLESGRILAPGSNEKKSWRAFVDYSDDNGKTWTRSAFITANTLPNTGIPKRGVIQPSLWQNSFNGSVHMLLRSSEGRIFRSDSRDNGNTWSEAYPTDLPNNNSGLDLVQDPDNGILYLVCNPIVDVTIGTKRSPLSLLYSRNEGTSWFKMCDLETGPREFSYPAVIMQDGNLIISYTYQRINIAVRTFTPVQLAKLRFNAKAL